MKNKRTNLPEQKKDPEGFFPIAIEANFWKYLSGGKKGGRDGEREGRREGGRKEGGKR